MGPHCSWPSVHGARQVLNPAKSNFRGFPSAQCNRMTTMETETNRNLSLTLFISLMVGMAMISCAQVSNSTVSHPSPPPPPGPAHIAAHSVCLSWKASTSAVAGYNIYRVRQPGRRYTNLIFSVRLDYTRLNSSLHHSTTYIDDKVQPGATYSYAVRAVDASSQESDDSNIAVAVIPPPYMPHWTLPWPFDPCAFVRSAPQP